MEPPPRGTFGPPLSPPQQCPRVTGDRLQGGSETQQSHSVAPPTAQHPQHNIIQLSEPDRMYLSMTRHPLPPGVQYMSPFNLSTRPALVDLRTGASSVGPSSHPTKQSTSSPRIQSRATNADMMGATEAHELLHAVRWRPSCPTSAGPPPRQVQDALLRQVAGALADVTDVPDARSAQVYIAGFLPGGMWSWKDIQAIGRRVVEYAVAIHTNGANLMLYKDPKTHPIGLDATYNLQERIDKFCLLVKHYKVAAHNVMTGTFIQEYLCKPDQSRMVQTPLTFYHHPHTDLCVKMFERPAPPDYGLIYHRQFLHPRLANPPVTGYSEASLKNTALQHHSQGNSVVAPGVYPTPKDPYNAQQSQDNNSASVGIHGANMTPAYRRHHRPNPFVIDTPAAKRMRLEDGTFTNRPEEIRDDERTDTASLSGEDR
ncbi:hypothetical protein P154DRAFT_574421 [Amniculicola lignicola CBS 123094]|uniref:Uncharacterized protein n=1 Tax=Amniculicola lignicola CBS 123094 TaxID=1392246 RepID=A0A6A5WKV1_9PLEO|nr:hypothetical protein P154DRAFT_574421 [Amniculicola lignicola CBS 123094]